MPSKSIGKRINTIKIGQKKVLIKFDNGDSLEILPNTFTEFSLFKGKVLSSKDIREINERNNVEKYYAKALNLLSKKSYSERQIKEKLTSTGACEKEIELVIKELYKYSLLDDKEVINEYLEYANNKNYGYNRIIDELYKRGLSRSDIEKIKYDEVSEYNKAKNNLAKLEKKYKNENNFQKKKKIFDSLVRLGFNISVAKDTSNEAKDNPHEVELSLLRKDYEKVHIRYNSKYKGKELFFKLNAYLLSKGYSHNDINSLIKGDYKYEMD